MEPPSTLLEQAEPRAPPNLRTASRLGPGRRACFTAAQPVMHTHAHALASLEPTYPTQTPRSSWFCTRPLMAPLTILSSSRRHANSRAQTCELWAEAQTLAARRADCARCSGAGLWQSRPADASADP